MVKCGIIVFMKKKVTKEILKYTVVFEPAREGGYVAYVPTLPGCFSQGETFEEANFMIKDAIEGYLSVLAEEKKEIPNESNLVISQVLVNRPFVPAF